MTSRAVGGTASAAAMGCSRCRSKPGAYTGSSVSGRAAARSRARSPAASKVSGAPLRRAGPGGAARVGEMEAVHRDVRDPARPSRRRRASSARPGWTCPPRRSGDAEHGAWPAVGECDGTPQAVRGLGIAGARDQAGVRRAVRASRGLSANERWAWAARSRPSAQRLRQTRGRGRGRGRRRRRRSSRR